MGSALHSSGVSFRDLRLRASCERGLGVYGIGPSRPSLTGLSAGSRCLISVLSV